MGLKILKFIGALALLGIITAYSPYGHLIEAGIVWYGLWKTIND